MIVITRQNDTLDDVCYRTLGRTDIITEVITANPGALHPPLLPAGLRIVVPDIVKREVAKSLVRLWD